eukprot:4261846-Pyramimonas_sp.AAC.1
MCACVRACACVCARTTNTAKCRSHRGYRGWRAGGGEIGTLGLDTDIYGVGEASAGGLNFRANRHLNVEV